MSCSRCSATLSPSRASSRIASSIVLRVRNPCVPASASSLSTLSDSLRNSPSTICQLSCPPNYSPVKGQGACRRIPNVPRNGPDQAGAASATARSRSVQEPTPSFGRLHSGRTTPGASPSPPIRHAHLPDLAAYAVPEPLTGRHSRASRLSFLRGASCSLMTCTIPQSPV